MSKNTTPAFRTRTVIDIHATARACKLRKIMTADTVSYKTHQRYTLDVLACYEITLDNIVIGIVYKIDDPYSTKAKWVAGPSVKKVYQNTLMTTPDKPTEYHTRTDALNKVVHESIKAAGHKVGFNQNFVR